jgi:hypothetical protein
MTARPWATLRDGLYVLVPDALAWCTDCCLGCWDERRFDHTAYRPVVCLEDGPATTTLAYRCRYGHDWSTSWDRRTAYAHAAESRDEKLAGPADRTWPPPPEPLRP